MLFDQPLNCSALESYFTVINQINQSQSLVQLQLNTTTMPLVAASTLDDDVKYPKLRELWIALKETFVEFAASTSIHGVQYIIDPHGTKTSKICWAIIVLGMFITSNVLVDVFWERYKTNPTRVNVDTNHAPMAELNFPAITICNIAKMSYERAYYVSTTVELPTNVTRSDLVTLLKQTDGFIDKISYNETQLMNLQQILFDGRYTVPLAMEYLMVPCKNLLYKCRFGGEEIPCMRLFKKSNTNRGYCCSFNIDQDRAEAILRKADYSGMSHGLSLAIAPLVENVSIADVYTDGIKLYVHESEVYPSEAVPDKNLPHETESYINIFPEVTIASSQLRAIPADSRGCVFPDEIHLK